MVIDNVLYFMQKCLDQCKAALEKDEVPVGAVIVLNNKVIAKAYNQTELLKDSTAHAEMLAISQASNFLKNKFLNEATIYVSVEPCLMCYGAIIHSRIRKIYFGAYEPKFGFTNFLKKNSDKIEIVGGFMESDFSILMKSFFKSKR